MDIKPQSIFFSIMFPFCVFRSEAALLWRFKVKLREKTSATPAVSQSTSGSQVTDPISVNRLAMRRMCCHVCSKQRWLCGAARRINVEGKMNDSPDLHISPGFELMKACTLFIDRKSLFGMVAVSTFSYEVR